MRKTVCFAIALLLFQLQLSKAHTQTRKDLSSVISQLLDQPAPPPEIQEVVEAVAARGGSIYGYYDSNPPDPGDDAPIKLLMDYWLVQKRNETGKQPSDKVRQRLLEACLEFPNSDSALFDFLPDTPEVHEKMRDFIEGLDPANQLPDDQYALKEASPPLRRWLMRHSGYYRNELIQAANQLEDKDYYIDGRENLEALAKLDWQAAKPIIEKYAAGNVVNLATLAVGLQYKNAIRSDDSSQSEIQRAWLKNILLHGPSPSWAKEHAMETLLTTDWIGRDDWYLSLFSNSSLFSAKAGENYKNPLFVPAKRDPDRWIPIISKLIGHPNRTIHNTAANCLAKIIGRQPRRDAVLPLIPWLSDPNWAEPSDEFDRVRIAENVGNLQIREAVPGLLRIIQNERKYIRSKGAESLAKLCDPRALPVLKEFIQTDQEDYAIVEMIKTFITCGGMSDTEKVAALHAAAEKLNVTVRIFKHKRNVQISGEDESLEVEAGKILADQKYVTEQTAIKLLDLLDSLRSEKPEVANKLWLIALQWEFPAIDRAIVERIMDSSADLETMLKAIDRRNSLRKNAPDFLYTMNERGGHLAGVATIILGNESNAVDILKGQDRDAQLALLACARMVRTSLPVELASELLKQKDPRLKLAAERYLESENSLAAQQILRTYHSGEILILGARNSFNPKPEKDDEWIKWENGLLDELKKKEGADEIYAELAFHYSDSTPFSSREGVTVRVRNDKAELCKQQDAARVECRKLSDDELQPLRAIFAPDTFDRLPSLLLPGSGVGGDAYEFIRLNKIGGKRAFASNLYFCREFLLSPSPYEQLKGFFYRLSGTGKFELRYALKEKNNNLEVLAANDKHPIKHVCMQGSEVRVLVKDQDYGWEKTETGKKWNDDIWNWHVLSGGKIGMIAEEPAACRILDDLKDVPEAMRRGMREEQRLWQIKAGEDVIREGEWNDQGGLWRCREGRDPVLIAKGSYSNPIVTSNGGWPIAIKWESAEGFLVRINLRSNQETKVNTDNFVYPITVVPASGKILFPRYRGGQEEHVLLNPVTGAIEVVHGEFRPLKDQVARPLQPVAGSREYWAAINDYEKKTTAVGRYDMSKFQFTKMFELPEILFDSMNMWVDESGGKIYIAYNGHLLRLPFPTKEGQSK